MHQTSRGSTQSAYREKFGAFVDELVDSGVEPAFFVVTSAAEEK